MKMPTEVFNLLTSPAAYKVKRLLSASDFAEFCCKRGEHVDNGRLRKLEQLGLFKPLLRIRRPDSIRKIQPSDAGYYIDLGSLQEGEVWSGETGTELLQFGFQPNIVASWRAHGLIWSPFDGPSRHDGDIDTDPQRFDAYYSEFQIWDLIWVLSLLTVTVWADRGFNGDGTPNDDHKSLARNISELVTGAIGRINSPNFRTAHGIFAQLISDRFYPQTQGDERTITITTNSCFYGWDWENYARTWTADGTVALFHLDQATSANIESKLSAEGRMIDPLETWRPLTRFIALEERKRLKDKPLMAETLKEMAEMHRLFHHLAFGVKLPDGSEAWSPRGGPAPPPVADAAYRALEWVTNRFNLNPKPKLVLIIEGETEDAVIPEIFKRWFTLLPAQYGIQLRNMRGVGNATGTKRDGQSALWRLVDFLHAQQTVAIVLLDREGLAKRNIEEGLANARSIHFPDRRVTRDDYIRIWDRCFELDNFSDSEIADAMTAVSNVVFVEADIEPCRQAQARKAKAVTIETVFRAKVGRDLNKVALSIELVEKVFDSRCERRPTTRPVVNFLEFVVSRAKLNHQPTTEESWASNQRSGFFGALWSGRGVDASLSDEEGSA